MSKLKIKKINYEDRLGWLALRKRVKKDRPNLIHHVTYVSFTGNFKYNKSYIKKHFVR